MCAVNFIIIVYFLRHNPPTSVYIYHDGSLIIEMASFYYYLFDANKHYIGLITHTLTTDYSCVSFDDCTCIHCNFITLSKKFNLRYFLFSTHLIFFYWHEFVNLLQIIIKKVEINKVRDVIPKCWNNKKN